MKTIGYAIVGTGYFGAELGRIMNCLLYTSPSPRD